MTDLSVAQELKTSEPGEAETPAGALTVTVAGEESAALHPVCPSPLFAAILYLIVVDEPDVMVSVPPTTTSF
jgi:hypothetical protein